MRLFDMVFGVLIPKRSSRYASSNHAFYSALDIVRRSAGEYDYAWVEIGHLRFLEAMSKTGKKVNDIDFSFISACMPVLWTTYQQKVQSLDAVRNYTPDVQHELQLALAEDIDSFPSEYSGYFEERIKVIVLLESCLRTCVLRHPFLSNAILEVTLVLWCNYLNAQRVETHSFLEFEVDLDSHGLLNPPTQTISRQALEDFLAVQEDKPRTEEQYYISRLSVPQQVEDIIFQTGTTDPSTLLVALRSHEEVHGLTITKMFRLVMNCQDNLSSQLSKDELFDDESLRTMSKILDSCSLIESAIKEELIFNEDVKGTFYEILRSVSGNNLILRESVIEELRRLKEFLSLQIAESESED